MGNLTKNLSVSEFACDCNYDDCLMKEVAHMPLVLAIQDAADHFTERFSFPVKVQITDGNRCVKNNIDIQMKWSGKTEAEARASKSKHLNGIAADHKFYYMVNGVRVDINPKEVAKYYDAKYPGACGIGLYDNRTHLDMRNYRARWDATGSNFWG